MTRVAPHLLWLGHAGDGHDYPALFREDIRALVHLAAEEPPERPPRDLIYCRVPLIDGPGNDPDRVGLAVQTVVHLLHRHTATLIFCGAGMSRSPAVAAAALSIVERRPAEECLEEVSRHKPVDVSPGLWNELRGALAEGFGDA